MNPNLSNASARKASKERTIAIALACLVVVAVLVVSFLPVQDKYFLHTKGRLHSWGHLFAFFVIGFITGRVARTLRGHILVFLAALFFGFFLEAGEHLIFGSGMEWKDVLTDSLGVVGGTLLALASLFVGRRR